VPNDALNLPVASRSVKRKCYSLWIARSVGLVFGFAQRPNTMLNPAIYLGLEYFNKQAECIWLILMIC